MDINGFEIEVYNIYKIPEKAKYLMFGLQWTDHRKTKKHKCMSVLWDTGLGQCNHCGETT